MLHLYYTHTLSISPSKVYYDSELALDCCTPINIEVLADAKKGASREPRFLEITPQEGCYVILNIDNF